MLKGLCFHLSVIIKANSKWKGTIWKSIVTFGIFQKNKLLDARSGSTSSSS